MVLVTLTCVRALSAPGAPCIRFLTVMLEKVTLVMSLSYVVVTVNWIFGWKLPIVAIEGRSLSRTRASLGREAPEAAEENKRDAARC